MSALGAMGLALPAAAGMARHALAAEQKLNFWSQLAGSKKAAGDQLEAAFKAAHPEITLNSSLFADPTQLNEKILTAINGNTAPDLFIQHWDYTLTYGSGGKLLEMQGALAGVDFATLDQGLLAYSRMNNGYVSIPLYGTSRGLGFNRKLVTEAGLNPDMPPKNWAELREWAKAMTKRMGGMLRVAGFNFFGNDLETWELFMLLLQGAGGNMLSPDFKTATFGGPEGVKALAFLLELQHADAVTDLGFGLGAGGPSSPFNQGRAAMIVAGNYNINNARKAGIDFDAAPFPKENGGFTSLVDPFCFAVPAATANKEAALAFIRFALTPAQQASFAAESKNVPLLKSAQSDPAVTADPTLNKFVAMSAYAPDTAPAVPAFSRMVTIIARAVQEALFKRATAEQALAAAAKEVQAVLDRA